MSADPVWTLPRRPHRRASESSVRLFIDPGARVWCPLRSILPCQQIQRLDDLLEVTADRRLVMGYSAYDALFVNHKCYPANKREDLIEFDSLQGKLTGNTYQLIDEIATNGIYVQKQKHQFFLYRYGEELVFQLDDFEILLGEEMNAHWSKSKRFSRNFELREGKDLLVKINYRTLPPISPFGNLSARSPIDFFEETSRIINDKRLFRMAFMPTDHFQA